MYKTHWGCFSLINILDSWNGAIENNLIPDDVIGFLLDYSNAKLDLEKGQEKKIVEYFNKNSNVFGGTRMAVIVNSPDEIIYPILIEGRQKSYTLKTFSTINVAHHWLLLNT